MDGLRRVRLLHGRREHLPIVLGPLRPAGELADEVMCEPVVCIPSQPAHFGHWGDAEAPPSDSQQASLKRLRSPMVGRKLGKSNIMAPWDQSAPSPVLNVAWPQEAEAGAVELDVEYVDVTTRSRAGPGVEECAHTPQHGVGLRHRHGQLEREAVQAELPLRLLVGVEAADEHVVVVAVDRPGGDDLVGRPVRGSWGAEDWWKKMVSASILDVARALCSGPAARGPRPPRGP